ncbi:MAG TPA: TRAP transporter substrate-binding protein DctP [Deltaproteobacteria bacterium]|nr:TRAP transporter substrate-binding protein DctP [Deltaproteobacteria bacterium]HPR55035.1 TRAP transporter substrate-binding protein DctP [Deltaproteobacteria bacterium]HXK48172.1 TRAP transporter substrate-binding protein DctP [Deltaproteobacteria bacterium]
MKTKIIAGMGALLVLCLCGGAGYAAADQARVVIKVASLAPKGSNIANLFDEISKQIKIKTNNEVMFKTYWGGVQGDELDVLRKVRLGQLHGGSFMGPALGLIAPEVRVTDLPYVFRNYDEVDYVRAKLQPEMERLLEEKGFKVLGWLNLGFLYTFSKEPLRSIDIAKKQKWWALEGDPMGQAMYKALDITPVSLSISDVATSLSTNLVDCAPATPFGAVAMQWYTRFKYMSSYPSSSINSALLVRKDIWDTISPASQKIILDVARTQHEKIRDVTRQEDAKALELLKKSGIKVVVQDPRNREAQYVFDAAKKARESLVGTLYSRELLDRTLSLVDEYRRLHPDDQTIIHVE